MTFKQQIAFWIVIGFNLFGLFFYLYHQGLFQLFSESIFWDIVGTLFLAGSVLTTLGIYLHSEKKNREEKEKEFYPIIVFNKRVNNNGNNWEIINYSRYPALECELNINYDLPEIDNFKSYYSSIPNYELEKSINKDIYNNKYKFFINLKKANHLKIVKTNKGMVKVKIRLEYKDLKGKKHCKENIMILKLSNFIMYDPIKGENTIYSVNEFIEKKDKFKNKKYDAIYEVIEIKEIS